MKSCVLKIDMDQEDLLKTFEILVERLKFLHTRKILNINYIYKIELVRKSKFSAKIFLKKDIDNDHIIIFQLILSSDWRKEAFSFSHLHISGNPYWNRLYDCKRYPDKSYKYASKYDVTNIIEKLVLDKSLDVKQYFEDLNEYFILKGIK